MACTYGGSNVVTVSKSTPRIRSALSWKIKHVTLAPIDLRYSHSQSHHIVRGNVLDLEEVHGANHRLHRHEDVLVHQLDEAPLVLVRVATAVNDAHLLDECGLARLTSACSRKRGKKRDPQGINKMTVPCIGSLVLGTRV